MTRRRRRVSAATLWDAYAVAWMVMLLVLAVAVFLDYQPARDAATLVVGAALVFGIIPWLVQGGMQLRRAQRVLQRHNEVTLGQMLHPKPQQEPPDG